MFGWKHATGHTMHTATQNTPSQRASRGAAMDRKWHIPPPGGHILSLGEAGLFVHRSEFFFSASVLQHVPTPLKSVQNMR